MTMRDILSLSRRLLQDTRSPYRWNDFELKSYAIIGIRKLNSIRPDTRYSGMSLTDGTAIPDSDDDAIAIDNKFLDALAYHVVYMAYLQDDTDTVNLQLAESYLSKFTAGTQL